jgi:hypothetical protein
MKPWDSRNFIPEDKSWNIRVQCQTHTWTAKPFKDVRNNQYCRDVVALFPNEADRASDIIEREFVLSISREDRE